jgi:hypothetical protein
MGISPTELALQRRLTRRFIEADSLTVVLMRSVPVSDGEGGTVRGVPTALPAQVMRLIPLQDGADEQLTADGLQVSPSYMLMGVWDADMDRWDQFTVDGKRYEVVSVNQNLQYETKGEVAYRGGG